MPQFQPRRFEQILPDMIARLVTRTNLTDVGDTSSVKQMLAAAAREDDEIYYQMENLLDLFSIDEASGDDLDERAAEIQPGTISRIGPRKATGTVIFSRVGTAGTVNISIGTRVKTGDGVVFITTAAGTITAASPEQIPGHGVGRDSSPVAILAESPGAAGNVVANTIVKFDSKPAGVDEVTNLTTTLFGRDKESDDAYRQRIKDYIAALARGTPLALEQAVLGAEDPATGGSILFAKAIEDPVNLGNVTLYIDDGTGSAETVGVVAATALAATYTWNGTTTVTAADTSEAVVGEFIRLDTDGQWFEIASITPSTSVTITNPGSLTIPSGATQSSISTGADKLTEGLAGPPADTAVGGEETLFTDNPAIKTAAPYSFVSSINGILVEGTDYTFNPATGQVQFTLALTNGEVIFGEYTNFTGLIAEAQKIVDGDPADRVNYPGIRAAGVLVRVLTPTVLVQTVEASLVVAAGYTRDDAVADAENVVLNYINSLGISDDVVRNEIISRIQALPSVFDLILTTPASNIPILDDQIARTTTATVSIV